MISLTVQFQHLPFRYIQMKSFFTFDQFFNFEIIADSHNFVLLEIHNGNYFLKNNHTSEKVILTNHSVKA